MKKGKPITGKLIIESTMPDKPRVNIKFRDHVLIFQFQHNYIPDFVPSHYKLVFSSDYLWHERRFIVGCHFITFTSSFYPGSLPCIPRLISE